MQKQKVTRNTKTGRKMLPKMMETPHFPRIRPHPGDRSSRPREGTFRRPDRRVGQRRPFCRRGRRGLLCGAGVALSRGRGKVGWRSGEPMSREAY